MELNFYNKPSRKFLESFCVKLKKFITMKKITLSLAVLAIAFAAQAQEIPQRKSERPHMMERKRHHPEMDMQKLNLTEEQKAKFKSQRESFHKQMEVLQKNDNITVKEWRNKAETLRKEHKASTEGILTTEQKAQMEKMKIEAKEKHGAMAKKGGERMKTQLGLTDEQSAKMDSHRKEMGEKMKSIRENKSLSDEQKKEQMKSLMKTQKENMKSILTEDQLKKLIEMKHRGHEGEKRGPGMKQPV